MWPHGRRPRRSAMHQQQPTRSSVAATAGPAWWYPPPAPPDYFLARQDMPQVQVPPPSNSREMRNRAEKFRRDKINVCIRELGEMVPMVSRSPKRVDKTSILRLTASHLRIHQILLNGFVPKKDFSAIDPSALEELIYEQLEGFLLILTPTGKIVFISHTVEKLLGHLQTDLMGHSIYTISSSDDHDKLRLHLSLDTLDSEWRRYFNLSLAKAGPRTESPSYEHFNVMGIMRPPEKSTSRELVPVSPSSSTSQSPTKPNNTVLVFFVKLYRPPPLSELLVEATKDEYITRHLIDGRIINCDHRISFVAGYMIEEVSGLSAFKFMHREDVRWTMIALRQMYDRGESVGWSCYRLLSRTGHFIYLRTFGYLEVDNSGVVESFVCVNTLVNEEEGIKLIREMKDRYSVMINANAQLTDSDASNASVEDPGTLEECIKYLITNHVPTSPKTESSNPSTPCENQDCYLTELGSVASTVAAAVTAVKGKRAPAEADDAGTRKRQKRRTVSSSSSTGGDPLLESYPSHHHRIVSSSSSLALGTR